MGEKSKKRKNSTARFKWRKISVDKFFPERKRTPLQRGDTSALMG